MKRTGSSAPEFRGNETVRHQLESVFFPDAGKNCLYVPTVKAGQFP